MIDWSVVTSVGRRTRTNHAIEHATITVLSSRFGNVMLRGRSNGKGFYVMGEVRAEDIESATREGIARLAGGESGLAVHPFCGTNLAVTGTLTGLAAAFAARAGRRSEAYPMAVLAALFAILLGQPLGMVVQRRFTTNSDVSGARLESVKPRGFLGKSLHFVRIGY